MRRSNSRGATTPPRWKKYSFPSSAAMKPKPRSATTFLTVPVVMYDPFFFPIQTADARSVGKGGRPRGASPQVTATSSYYSLWGHSTTTSPRMSRPWKASRARPKAGASALVHLSGTRRRGYGSAGLAPFGAFPAALDGATESAVGLTKRRLGPIVAASRRRRVTISSLAAHGRSDPPWPADLFPRPRRSSL